MLHVKRLHGRWDCKSTLGNSEVGTYHREYTAVCGTFPLVSLPTVRLVVAVIRGQPAVES